MDGFQALRFGASRESLLDLVKERRWQESIVEAIRRGARYGAKVRTRPHETIHLANDNP
jgi:hypothetical protein